MAVIVIFNTNDYKYRMRTDSYVKNVYRTVDVEAQTIETIIVFEDSTLLNNNKFSEDPYKPINMKYTNVYCENYEEFLEILKKKRTSVTYKDMKEIWNYDLADECTANLERGFCNCCGTLTQDNEDLAQFAV